MSALRNAAFGFACMLTAPFVTPAFGQKANVDTTNLTKTERVAAKRFYTISTNNNFRNNIYYQHSVPFSTGFLINFKRSVGYEENGNPTNVEELNLIYKNGFGKTVDEKDTPSSASYYKNAQQIVIRNDGGKWTGEAFDNQILYADPEIISAEKLEEIKTNLFKLEYGDTPPEMVLKNLMKRFAVKAAWPQNRK